MSGLGDSVSATWVPRPAVDWRSPLSKLARWTVLMNRPTHTMPPTLERCVGTGRSTAESGRTRACVSRRGFGCAGGGDGGRSKTEGGASLLGDGTFSRYAAAKVKYQAEVSCGCHWAFSESSGFAACRTISLPSSARLGRTGRAANQTGRIRPERMGDWICKAGGVGDLECYAKDDG